MSRPGGVSSIISRQTRFGLRGLLAIALLFFIGISARATTVAQWTFNAANPTADSSGNGNTLAFTGDAITFSSDVSSNATGTTNSAVFDGATYAQTVATLNLTSYNALTIEFFAKYTSGNGLQMFYAQNNPNNVVGAFYFDTGESSATGLKAAQRTSLGFETDTAPGPTDGAWHHYALTIDESGATPAVKIYVDGYEVDAGAGTNGIQGFINDFFTIGAYPPSYIFPYQGLMGEMRISSGILPPSQFLIGAQVSKVFISQQPHNTAVLTNSPATFNVVATVQNGTQPLLYQWQRNGANISGATNSSYTLSAVSLSDNSAQFDVVVSAAPAPSVTSSNAILTVKSNTAVAWWTFDAANPAADSSGDGNTLTFTGDPITFSSDVSPNAIGTTNSVVFDGATYAQTTATLDLTPYKALTIEFFTKYTSGNGLQMFYTQNNPNNVVGAFYFDMGESSATGLKVAQRTSLGFETDIAPGPTDGDWHHYALTIDESGTTPVLKIYVDGYEVDAGAGSDGIQGFINDFFTIGAYPPSYIFPYQGLMGEMRISSGILPPSQFLIGAQVSKVFISQQPHNVAVLTNSPATFNVVATVQNGTQPLLYQWQRNGANISGATNSSYTLPTASLSDSSAQFDVVVSAPPAPPVTSSNAALTVLSNATVALWTFDAANPTADSSGNGNTLAFSGDAITFSSDVSPNATGTTNSAVFDGAAYAQTVATLNLTSYSTLTIEFFAKYTSGGGLQMFFAQNNPNNVVGAFYFDKGESSATGLKTAQRTASGFETDVSPGATDGAWHHYAMTIDESGISPVIKIYVDGLRVDTGASSDGIQTFINDFFTIGSYPPTYIFDYVGMLGEMRISGIALTPAQFLVGPAKLQFGITNGNATISWPQNAGSFTLQQSTNVLGGWTAVTNSPVASGLNLQVTVPTSSRAMFYRLFR